MFHSLLNIARLGITGLAAYSVSFGAPQESPVLKPVPPAKAASPRPNVLFIISDDLTATALSCYGNEVARTPNLDKLAKEGAQFTRAYCQFPVCGPSRASFMSGYYPHATGVYGYTSGREGIGDRATWAQFFKNEGYRTTRVSKIFHMGVPAGIEQGTDGADDARSWTQRFNSQGPEWKAAGEAVLLEGNPGKDKAPAGGNHFAYVKADGDDLAHSDGRAAQMAIDVLREQVEREEPFFLAVGFVRPHVPFVAPAKYFELFPMEEMMLPGGVQPWEEVPLDWADLPKAGINYRTSFNMKMDLQQRRASIAAYYASVAYVDSLVGQLLAVLEECKLDQNTIVVFTSDHGFHLGEHDFWAKVSLHEESARVPLLIRMPGRQPIVCSGFTELVDLYPTLVEACGFPTPDRLQGRSQYQALSDASFTARDTAFCVNGKNNGFLLRNERWAYIQYREDASKGMELYDMRTDPKQLRNLAKEPDQAGIVAELKNQLAKKLLEVRTNDLN